MSRLNRMGSAATAAALLMQKVSSSRKIHREFVAESGIRRTCGTEPLQIAAGRDELIGGWESSEPPADRLNWL